MHLHVIGAYLEYFLLLAQILLEQGSITTIAKRMQDYQVLAMVILLGQVMGSSSIRTLVYTWSILFSYMRMKGMLLVTSSHFLGFRPKMQHVQNQVQQYVKNLMSEQLHMPSTALRPYGKINADHRLTKPAFIASCSVFGPKVLPSTPSPIRQLIMYDSLCQLPQFVATYLSLYVLLELVPR